MQTKRIVITLDPDYVPWEHKEDVVRLRKKRVKVPKFFIAIIVIIGVLVFAVLSQTQTTNEQTAQATPEPSPTVVAVAVQNPYTNWCEFGGLLLAPGVHQIGDQERECRQGELLP